MSSWFFMLFNHTVKLGPNVTWVELAPFREWCNDVLGVDNYYVTWVINADDTAHFGYAARFLHGTDATAFKLRFNI